MLLATHAVVAGVIGERIGNPFLAFLVGIIIHFLLDAIPHFDTTDEHKLTFRQCAYITGDFIAGAIIIIFVMKANLSLKSPFLWGVIGGILPDVFDNVPVISDWFRRNSFGRKVHSFHEYVQSIKVAPWLGALTQYGILALFVICYLLKK